MTKRRINKNNKIIPSLLLLFVILIVLKYCVLYILNLKYNVKNDITINAALESGPRVSEFKLQKIFPEGKLDYSKINLLKSKTIIAFGDSLTAGYGVSNSQNYPAQLEERLLGGGYNVKIINEGKSGETSAANNKRAKSISLQDPDIVILGIGENDLFKGLTVEDMESNIESTIRTLIANGKTKVILLKMQAPLTRGVEYKKRFDTVYEKLAIKYNLELVPFVKDDVFLNPEYMSLDQKHPNGKGYKKILDEGLYQDVVKVINQN